MSPKKYGLILKNNCVFTVCQAAFAWALTCLQAWKTNYCVATSQKHCIWGRDKLQVKSQDLDNLQQVTKIQEQYKSAQTNGPVDSEGPAIQQLQATSLSWPDAWTTSPTDWLDFLPYICVRVHSCQSLANKEPNLLAQLSSPQQTETVAITAEQMLYWAICWSPPSSSPHSRTRPPYTWTPSLSAALHSQPRQGIPVWFLTKSHVLRFEDSHSCHFTHGRVMLQW